ncbi:MAG TPA: hypothetical protein PK317_00005, partial [Coprothermobacter proteolyticus]|nr:hypothetical protein [Coprothermobacter proteolyticus]
SGEVVGTTDAQTVTNKTLGANTKLGAVLDANNFAIQNSPDIIRLNQRPMQNFNSATIPYMVFSRL